jgi:hypothetical protein
MDTTFFIWGAAALVAVLAGLAVWWRQKQRLARLQNLLRDAEDSRLELFDEARTLRQQLHASVKAPSTARAAAASAAVADAALRRAALDKALDAAAPAPAGAWQDTLPMAAAADARKFQLTQPAPLATQPAEMAGDGKR